MQVLGWVSRIARPIEDNALLSGSYDKTRGIERHDDTEVHSTDGISPVFQYSERFSPIDEHLLSEGLAIKQELFGELSASSLHEIARVLLVVDMSAKTDRRLLEQSLVARFSPDVRQNNVFCGNQDVRDRLLKSSVIL